MKWILAGLTALFLCLPVSAQECLTLQNLKASTTNAKGDVRVHLLSDLGVSNIIARSFVVFTVNGTLGYALENHTGCIVAVKAVLSVQNK